MIKAVKWIKEEKLFVLMDWILLLLFLFQRTKTNNHGWYIRNASTSKLSVKHCFIPADNLRRYLLGWCFFSNLFNVDSYFHFYFSKNFIIKLYIASFWDNIGPVDFQFETQGLRNSLICMPFLSIGCPLLSLFENISVLPEPVSIPFSYRIYYINKENRAPIFQ